MRVAYIGNMTSDITRVWIEEMASRGVVPIAFDPARPDWGIEWGHLDLGAVRVRGLGLGTLAIGKRIRELVMRHAIDVVHTHQANDAVAWVDASKVHPHVITCWGSDVMRLDGQSRSRRWKVRRALKNADVITAGSQSLLQAAVRAGAASARTTVVGWGVDTQRYCPNALARERIRAEWNLRDRFVVLSTRRLEPLYRVDAVLRAFPRLQELEPRAALVIASDGTESEALKALAVELGIEQDTRFLGAIPHDAWPAMTDIYAGADAYVSVPETDGGPLSVLEAMAASLPIVASDVSVMREWVLSTDSGILWDGARPATLADAMLAALLNREALGQNARDYVVRCHERAAEMDRAREVYDQALFVRKAN